MNRVLIGCADSILSLLLQMLETCGDLYIKPSTMRSKVNSRSRILGMRSLRWKVRWINSSWAGPTSFFRDWLAFFLATLCPVYLQQTQSLRQDLDSYSQVDQIIYRQQSVSLSQQLQSLSREYSLLNEYGSKRPLTQAYLQRAIKNGVDASKQQLANLPDFQFDEASYLIPTAISQSDELALLARDIKTIDESLAQVSEVRAVVAQPELLKTAEDLVGDSEAAALKATADQIGTAERVRASLADTQNSLQTKIAAEKRLQDEQQARKQAQAARAAQMEAQKRAEEQRERRIAETQEAETKKAADEASDAEGCNLLATNKMGVSAQAREEYAEQATQKAAEKMGPDVIYNTAAGDNNRYLLMAAPPEHEGELNGYALAMANSQTFAQLSAWRVSARCSSLCAIRMDTAKRS